MKKATFIPIKSPILLFLKINFDKMQFQNNEQGFKPNINSNFQDKIECAIDCKLCFHPEIQIHSI
jgi:hypothetical protein